MQGLIPVVLGVAGLVAAFQLYKMVLRHPAGSGKVVEIGDAIHEGAMVFLKREYTILATFVAVVAVLLALSLGFNTVLAFLLGASCSAMAGYFGMFAATRANVRTTTAAHEEGAAAALSVAFFWWLGYGPDCCFTGSAGTGYAVSLFRRRSGNCPCHSRFRHGRFMRGAVLPCRRRHFHQERRYRR